MPAEPRKKTRRESSQTLRAQIAIRDLVLSGVLRAGERLSELSMVDRLGVSRTPVRMALARLEDEGYLEVIPSGGFAVKAFTAQDVFDSVEIRGLLEGMAARRAAERGVSDAELQQVEECLLEIDAVVTRANMTEDDFAEFVELNARFHLLLAELANSPVLTRQIERASAVPFTSPAAFLLTQGGGPDARTTLGISQDQHRRVIEAIVAREGARAEGIMREHARMSSRDLALILRSPPALTLVPGAGLLHGSSQL
jgi:GntR family transcriptional regulator of vanillate catabolism